MNARTAICISCGLLTMIIRAAFCRTEPTLGIPEPGLLMFGPITNAAGGPPFLINTVTWQVSGGSPAESATIQATVVSVNGQFFYIARVPFETRSVRALNFGATSNVLGLTQSPITYTRSVHVNGTKTTIMSSSRGMLDTFTFGAADRGISERVDLQVNIPVDPNQDSDGDGMPDWAEQIAGTDPNDPQSVLKLNSKVQPLPEGGLTITWSTVSGKTYSIFRTSDLNSPLDKLTDKSSAGDITTFTDTTAIGPGPFFYRIQANP